MTSRPRIQSSLGIYNDINSIITYILIDDSFSNKYGTIDNHNRIFMINQIMNVHPYAVAKVKLDNNASLKLFERCGFKKK